MAKEFILPKDIPLDQYPKPEVFLEEGKRLAVEGQKRGINLRLAMDDLIRVTRARVIEATRPPDARS